MYKYIIFYLIAGFIVNYLTKVYDRYKNPKTYHHTLCGDLFIILFYPLYFLYVLLVI